MLSMRRATSVMLGACAVLRPAGSAADTVAPLELPEAVHLALTRNERAKISDLQVVASQAAVERARTAFLPVVSLVGQDAQHPSVDHPANVGSTSFTVNQPLLNASAFPLYSQAKALAQAQQAQNVDDKRLLAFSAASAFFSVLNAEAILQASQRQLDMATSNLADTQARVQAQLNSSNDATRAHVDLASSARQVELGKGNLDAAYVQLAFTINAPVGGLVAPEPTLHAADQPVAPIDTLVRFALERRPDVLVAKHAAIGAHDFADEPLLRIVPTLGLQGQATGTTNTPAATGRWNDETVTATLSWTLYDAGVRYADKHLRDAQASISDWNLKALLRTVDAQVRSAVALLLSAQAAFHVAEQAMLAARQSVEETAILYRQGLARAIELVDATDQRFTAEVNYVSAEYGMAQAYLNVRQSLGLDPLGTELK
jgi:outer membrane protein TolC